MTNQHLAHAPIIKSTDWQIRWVGVTALTWIVSVLALASWNAFNVPASEPALPTVIALLVPVVAFVAAMFLSKDLRAVAMNLDPVLHYGIPGMADTRRSFLGGLCIRPPAGALCVARWVR
jgi:hypothetical protein